MMECWITTATENTKYQITNYKQITMTKIQNSNLCFHVVFEFGTWDFLGIWCLEFEILQDSTTPMILSQPGRCIGNLDLSLCLEGEKIFSHQLRYGGQGSSSGKEVPSELDQGE